MNSKRIRQSIALILTALTLFSVAGCSAGTKKADTIKFACVGPMTGDNAAAGQFMKNACDIAVEEINGKGGVLGSKLEFEVFDDMASPNQALIAGQKVASDKDIRFVVGHANSGCTLAALPTYKSSGIPAISGSNSSPTITEQGFDNFFRTCLDDNINQAGVTEFAIKELGNSKPALIYENTEYGKGMLGAAKEKLTELGITAISESTYNPSTDRDFSAQITEMKANDADCVLFMGEYAAAGIFLKQRESLALNAPVIGCTALYYDELINIAGSAANGFYTGAQFSPYTDNEIALDFIARYEEKYGITPNEYATFNYDSIMAYVNAIEYMGKTDFTQEELIAALHTMPAFAGVAGDIKFDEKGNIAPRPIYYFQVVDEAFAAYPTK